MKVLLCQICDGVSKSREKSRNDGLEDKILEYLNTHYQEPGLCISSLADAFHISPISLSHFFKEQSSETLLDAINHIRLKKAKELMRQDLNISQVAEKVGYGNTDTFIRNFKKYEGITPGKYKSLYSGA